MVIRSLVAFVLIAPLVACNSAGDGGDENAVPAQSSAAEPQNLEGEWPGTITRGDAESEAHTIEVLDYVDGQLQLGLQEFCNIDLEGEAPSWSSADGASCLVDLGNGSSPTDVSASVRLEGDRILVVANFDGGVMWSFEGSR